MSQKYHILIVEDFAPDAELAEREIRDVLPQCIFRRVDTRKDFIAALAEFQPDLIVSDYQMPGFDGMAVLRLTLGQTPLTPVIIVTGSVNEDTAVACMKAGVVDYVLKDSLKRLGPSVQHALEQRQINLDRQNAQASLVASEQRYRLLFETMAQGVVYQDANGRIIAANPAAERILGVTLDQMQGRSSLDSRWRTIHPDGPDFPGDDHPSMVALRTGQEVRDVLMGVWHPAEERRHWIRVSAVPQFRAGDAAPYQVYTTFADITELIESELQIRHLNSVLKAVRNINQLIVRERDRQRLLQAACENLTQTRGFSSAYIVLFDAAQRLALAAESGWAQSFPAFLAQIVSGVQPYCIRQGLECETGTLVEETTAICGVCPLAFAAEHKQAKKIIAPIRQAGQYQGVLTVALSKPLLIDPDELALLDEVAGDLAFALRNLDIEDQRQQAETSLRESEALFRNLFERHAAIKLLIDPGTGEIVDANDAAVNYYGWTKAQLRQMRIQDINMLSPSEVQQEMEKARTLRRVHFEFRHRRADGAIRDVEVFSSKIEAQGRDLLHSIVHDVTERKEVETQLAEERKLLQVIADMIPDVVYLYHPQQRQHLYINKEMAALLGYSTEEILRVDADIILQQVHPADLPNVMRHVETLAHTASDAIYPLEYRIQGKDGNYLWFYVREQVYQRDSAGRPETLFGICQNITERKQAEAALRVSEERYRSLFNGMTEGFALHEILCDADGVPCDYRFLDINPSFERLTGLKRADVVGRLQSQVLPAEDPKWVAMYGRVALTGEPCQFENYSPVLKRHFEVVAYCPAPRQFAAIFMDVTARKQAEEEIHQLNTELEQRVIARTTELQNEIAVRTRAEQELQHAKELAEQANRAKSDFLANMSHDLRTPLNAILGYAQILQEADNLTGRQQHGLETIHTSGEHLLALINEILDLSKIEAGRLELNADDIHLPTFLNNLARMIQVRASQKGLNFVQERDPALPEGIRADETRLQEVLLNLLGNAVKFTDHGSVTFRILDLGFKIVDLEDAQQSKIKNLKFEIIDTGPGIASQDIEKIFEPFQQAGAKRTNFGGTGLGLAISRRLVRMMGGDLQVESAPGQGSRFWFNAVFPVAPAPAVAVARSLQKIVGYTGQRRTILIADDEETNRNLLLNLLFPLDFRIVEATNGQQCLEKALKYQPDVILLDLRMPVLDGFSATEQLRQIEALRDVTIVAVSASVFAETRQRALDIGFDDFLFKPVYQDALYALLQKYLQLDWIYAGPAEPPAEFQAPPFDLKTISPLPMLAAEHLYAAARRGNHKKVLEYLARIEQAGAEFRPLAGKLRDLAQRFDTDAIVKILDDLGMKA